MQYAKRFIGLLCPVLLAAGCRDAVQPSAHLHGPSLTLVGASTRVFSTYLGSSADDDGGGTAVDANGYVYVTGASEAADFPTTAGAFRTANAGGKDVVITKLDPSGAGLVYSTYVGGTAEDGGEGIAIDASGSAYVVGHTYSSDFPTTAGAFQAVAAGRLGVRFAGFVTKLDPAGTALVYSTFLGGSGSDDAKAIAVDGAGNAYVTGVATSSDFPTTAGAVQSVQRGQEDGFVTELNASGAALVYSTYLGGGSTDRGNGIAIDAGGYAYVIGRTTSSDFPTTAGAFQTTKNSSASSHAAFVSKVAPGGSALVYSTYLAGTGSDRGVAIALDASANAYVTGRASSTDFPTTPGALQATSGGLRDVFVAELNASGSALVYSTYLGGAADDEGAGIAVDGGGNVYVAGTTESTNFPVTAGAAQPTAAAVPETFVARLSPSTSTLLYSTFLGGGGSDEATGLAIDAGGYAYVTGVTGSSDFPTTAGAFDPSFNGINDLFLAKIAAFGQAATLTLAPASGTGVVNTQQCVTATVRDAAANPAPAVTVLFSVTGVDTVSGAATTDASGQGTFCYTGARTGDDTVAGTADTNDNGVPDPGEPSGTATRTWVVGPPATLALAPDTATALVNTEQCVTATVRDAAANAVPAVTVRFFVTGVDTTAGSATTDASGQSTFCYSGTRAGDDTITATADTNNDGVPDPGEPSDTATKTWVIGPPATLTLAPDSGTVVVNTQQCVTATVRDAAANAVPGVTVRFSVTGVNTTAGSATTDAGGQSTFCYSGTQAGDDAITAFADTDGSGVQDPGEPSGAATKTWVVVG